MVTSFLFQGAMYSGKSRGSRGPEPDGFLSLEPTKVYCINCRGYPEVELETDTGYQLRRSKRRDTNEIVCSRLSSLKPITEEELG